MRRREFFGLLAGAGAASVITPGIVETALYVPSYAHWSGWRQPANQDVLLGWWFASGLTPSGSQNFTCMVSTVGGVVHRIHEGQCVDCTFMEGWPWLTPRTSELIRENSKHLALLALMGAVEGGL